LFWGVIFGVEEGLSQFARVLTAFVSVYPEILVLVLDTAILLPVYVFSSNNRFHSAIYRQFPRYTMYMYEKT